MIKEVQFNGCTDAQANWGQGYDPRVYLAIGGKYIVDAEEEYSRHTLFYLRGFVDTPFNSACFDIMEAAK